MKKTLLLLTVVIVCGAAAITIHAQEDTGGITLKTVESKTVLYTVIRGHYAQMGRHIEKLYALAIKKGIKPVGDLRTVYLNNPTQVDNHHWLYEIQIPVDKEALSLAGTLGEMTDVKQLPAMKAATIKRQNIMADPTELYEQLFDWISAQRLIPIDDPIEAYLKSNQVIDYSKMQSEIMVPIE
ncbi:MAG: GyrI-like domain-containing protein [Planctomycetota bacterium]